MRLVALTLCLGALCGCRLGEPAAISFADRAAAVDNDITASGGASVQNGVTGGNSSPTSGAGGGAGESGSGAAGTSAEASAGTSGAGASGTAGDPDESDASAGDEDSASCAPNVQGCNPVTNDACPDFMQCVVDLGTDVLAGYCTFTAPMTGGCFNSGVTESCPPTSTCVDFECRTLCFCDDDCGAGECCVEPVGTLGFKVCGTC